MINRIDPKSTAGIRTTPEMEGVRSKDSSSGLEFSELLKEARQQNVQFSKHASERLEKRSIELSTDDLALLSNGINRAEMKGSKESLLLMDDTAFVVNVTKRTVITAVDKEGMKEKTFTNIDSAILLDRK